jgi:hypothetical protein
MTETPLKNQIIIWLKGYDYWFQYAGNRLLEGEIISTELIDSTYKLFKEDYGLQPIELERADILFNEIAIDTVSAIGHLELQTIKEIENVNALASGQLIQINPALTIIYGGNGAGKSGYVRLLNNAFKSRGDKHILQNVFDDTQRVSQNVSLHLSLRVIPMTFNILLERIALSFQDFQSLIPKALGFI